MIVHPFTLSPVQDFDFRLVGGRAINAARHHPFPVIAQSYFHYFRYWRKLFGGITTSDDATFDYWVKWYAANRSPAFLERLRRARAEADARALVVKREEIQRRVLELSDRHGLRDDRCLKLCTRHLVLREAGSIGEECHSITRELLAYTGRRRIAFTAPTLPDKRVRIRPFQMPEVAC